MGPMEIRYASDVSGVCWQRISELFQAVGWEESHPQDLEQAFGRSTYVRVAYDQDKIVGVGRTVDDGKYYGMIVDLVVDPAYQGRGIGSTMLQQLRVEMAGFRVVSLRAAKGKHGFYLKHGWKKSRSAFHWPG